MVAKELQAIPSVLRTFGADINASSSEGIEQSGKDLEANVLDGPASNSRVIARDMMCSYAKHVETK